MLIQPIWLSQSFFDLLDFAEKTGKPQASLH